MSLILFLYILRTLSCIVFPVLLLLQLYGPSGFYWCFKGRPGIDDRERPEICFRRRRFVNVTKGRSAVSDAEKSIGEEQGSQLPFKDRSKIKKPDFPEVKTTKFKICQSGIIVEYIIRLAARLIVLR